MDPKDTNSVEEGGVPLVSVGQHGTTQISGIGLLSEDIEVGLSLYVATPRGLEVQICIPVCLAWNLQNCGKINFYI